MEDTWFKFLHDTDLRQVLIMYKQIISTEQAVGCVPSCTVYLECGWQLLHPY